MNNKFAGDPYFLLTNPSNHWGHKNRSYGYDPCELVLVSIPVILVFLSFLPSQIQKRKPVCTLVSVARV